MCDRECIWRNKQQLCILNRNNIYLALSPSCAYYLSNICDLFIFKPYPNWVFPGKILNYEDRHWNGFMEILQGDGSIIRYNPINLVKRFQEAGKLSLDLAAHSIYTLDRGGIGVKFRRSNMIVHINYNTNFFSTLSEESIKGLHEYFQNK